MAKDIDVKEEISPLRFHSESDCEENLRKHFSELKVSEEKVLERLQTPHHRENLFIFNEVLNFTRYDGDEVSSLFQIDASPSYIIIEKCPDIQKKMIKNIPEWENVEACSTPKRSLGSSGQYSEMDITGSPLGCPFQDIKQSDLELSFQESFESVKQIKFPLRSYHGFPVSKARSLAFNMKSSLKILRNDDIYLPPVWVACDGKDSVKTVFLGVHQSMKTNSTCSMTSSGPHIGIESLPTIDRLSSHFSLGYLQWRVSTEVEATYEVLSSKGRKESSVDLCCRWAQPLSTLSSPGLDTVTTASLHLEVSDEKSRSRFLYLEFEIVRNLIDGLSENCLKWYRKKGERNVADFLQEYILHFNDRVPGQKIKSGKDSVLHLDKIVEDKFLEMRPNMEFTDEMWNILKRSESLSELSDGFKTIFNSISSGAIRPRIHVRNDTEFAVICRNLMRGQGKIPFMEKWEPIEMLIQIGLEKIKKDYVSVFQVCDLVTDEQLSLYTNWSAKKLPFSQCLAKLQKMQVVLQIVVILRSALNLPDSFLSRVTSKTLLDLGNKTELPKDFEFQVDTSLVKPIIDNIVPSIWVYEMWSECDENPNCGKWVKFAIKKYDDFFEMKSEEEKEIISQLIDDENSQSEGQKFYCLSIVRTGDIF